MTDAATAQAATSPLGHIYWSDASGNTIGRAYLDGTGVDQSFISGASGPSNVLVHGQYIYWGNATGCTQDGACNGSIGRAHLDGTDVNKHTVPTDTPYGSRSTASTHLLGLDGGLARSGGLTSTAAMSTRLHNRPQPTGRGGGERPQHLLGQQRFEHDRGG